jgi:hypothetical protein
MTARKVASLLTACASVFGTVSCITVVALAGGPAMANSFKESNGWSSGDYFGPRAGAFSPALNLAADFRERNGYYSGDYFGPKG